MPRVPQQARFALVTMPGSRSSPARQFRRRRMLAWPRLPPDARPNPQPRQQPSSWRITPPDRGCRVALPVGGLVKGQHRVVRRPYPGHAARPRGPQRDRSSVWVALTTQTDEGSCFAAHLPGRPGPGRAACARPGASVPPAPPAGAHCPRQLKIMESISCAAGAQGKLHARAAAEEYPA